MTEVRDEQMIIRQTMTLTCPDNGSVFLVETLNDEVSLPGPSHEGQLHACNLVDHRTTSESSKTTRFNRNPGTPTQGTLRGGGKGRGANR